MKYFYLVLILIVFFTFPTYAIDGYIQLEYDTMGNYSNGELYIYKDFGNFQVGGKFKANLTGYSTKKDIVPSGVPASQIYDLIIEYNMTDNVVIKMIDGCKHYFDQSNYTENDDISYLKFGVKYQF